MSSATRTCELWGGPLDGLSIPWEWPKVHGAHSTYYVVGTDSGLAIYRVYASSSDPSPGGGYEPIGAAWQGYNAPMESVAQKAIDGKRP